MSHRIAIIDDSSVMRSVLRKTIAASHVPEADVVEAKNGREGYELIKANAGALNLAFVDLHMPEMGGVEMLQALHSEGLTKFPIVVVSAEGDMEMHEHCRKNCAMEFVQKPFRPQDIVSLIQRVVAQ